MITIYKYGLWPSLSTIEMPDGAQPLSCGAQGENLTVWCQVDTDAKARSRRFFVAMTGEPVRVDVAAQARFLGTVQMGPIVLHVFDCGWAA